MAKKISTITYYMTSSKEFNMDVMNDMADEGLLDDISMKQLKKFEENWVYALYKVEFDLDIYDDGTYKIQSVDGSPVIHKPSQLKLKGI